jgi:hypothetical protein
VVQPHDDGIAVNGASGTPSVEGENQPSQTRWKQMSIVGPQSLMIALLTSTFVGMVFTIQVARELLNLWGWIGSWRSAGVVPAGNWLQC